MAALAWDHPDLFPLSLTVGASHTGHLRSVSISTQKYRYHTCTAGDRRTLLTTGIVHAVAHCEEVIVLEGILVKGNGK